MSIIFQMMMGFQMMMRFQRVMGFLIYISLWEWISNVACVVLFGFWSVWASFLFWESFFNLSNSATVISCRQSGHLWRETWFVQLASLNFRVSITSSRSSHSSMHFAWKIWLQIGISLTVDWAVNSSKQITQVLCQKTIRKYFRWELPRMVFVQRVIIWVFW